MIIPKKEILYAPMLGTLGGGSARAFGQGAGGLAAYDTGLWAMGDAIGQDGYGMVKYDTGNFDRLITSTNIPCNGSYPSVMADTYRSSTGSVYLISADNGVLQVWSSSSLNQIAAVSVPSNTRGMMVHGNYAYWADNNGSFIRKYNLSNISSPNNVQNENNGYGSIDWEGNVAVDGYLYFGGGQGYIAVFRESDFSRMVTTRVNSNTNEITAMCYGANGALYAGYQSGDIVRFTSYQNGLNATHNTTIQNTLNTTIEDLEVDRFGNIHCLSRGGNDNYEVFRGSDLYSITHGSLPFSAPPAGIILNDYMYVGDHSYTGQHYKYYIPDVVAGTFSPTNAGSKRGPTTNTLLSSYNQSDLHQKNLEQGGLSF